MLDIKTIMLRSYPVDIEEKYSFTLLQKIIHCTIDLSAVPNYYNVSFSRIKKLSLAPEKQTQTIISFALYTSTHLLKELFVY